MELTKNVYVSNPEKINPACGHHSGRNLFQLIFSSLMNFRKDNVAKIQRENSFCDPKQSHQNHTWRMCGAAGPLHHFPNAGSCVDVQFVLLRFRQLHRPVADVKLQFVSHILRGQTNASKPNVNAADYFCLCFSFTLCWVIFISFPFHTFPDVTADDRSLCGGCAKLPHFSNDHGSDFIHVESTFVQQPNMSHQQLHHSCQHARQNNR